ncbi:MAG: MBOAT family protein [Eubacterium sp.]|nr:MBOAT family protein [Eubacterium sp.]
MTLNSLVFLVFFFPISVLICRLVPGKFRNIVLIILSLLFYAWGNPQHLLLLLLSVLFNYAAGLEIGQLAENGNRSASRINLIIAVVINIFVLCIFKYTSLSLPLGISFYTFSALSYLFDVYYGNAPASKNPLDTVLYITFFPKVISGPIVKYKDMIEQIKNPVMTSAGFMNGLSMFLFGLFKKVLLADRLGVAFAQVQAQDTMTGSLAWLSMILYSLQLYFDFSGYSDMAIGLARMLGFSFEKNFDYPYLSGSVSEFWRRWHISLGSWFKEYVYIPLGGNRGGNGVTFRNLAIVWILTGIWHGSTLNFVFWGIWHGIFVILEKFIYGKKLDRLPAPIRIIYTDLVAFFGWIFFFTPDLKGAFSHIGMLFGAGVESFWSSASAFCFSENILVVIVAFIFCGPLVRKLYERAVYKNAALSIGFSVCIFAILFAFSIASIVGSTNTTFMYAQF